MLWNYFVIEFLYSLIASGSRGIIINVSNTKMFILRANLLYESDHKVNLHIRKEQIWQFLMYVPYMSKSFSPTRFDNAVVDNAWSHNK